MDNRVSMFNQPKPFRMIFIIELWERFGYYGLQGILAVYFVNKLGFSQADAFITFGAFAALVYGLVSIGGFIGDHVLGTKRTMILGAFVLTLGYVTMGLTIFNSDLIFVGLSIIAVGNGLFKANPSSLLAKCYEKGDPRIDGAFTLYYMAINIGSFLSLSICPVVADKFGYPVAFSICAIGLAGSLFTYYALRKTVEHIGSQPDLKPMNKKKFAEVLLGTVGSVAICTFLLKNITFANIALALIVCGVMGQFFKEMFKETGVARSKMVVVLVLMIEAVIFYVLYAQMPTSLNFFAIHNVNCELFGFQINPVSLQALNPFWVVACSPFLAYFYTKYGSQGRDFSMPAKFTIGMFMCAIGFLSIAVAGYGFADEFGKVSIFWMFLIYFFQSMGELLISGLGLAMVASLVPKRLTGFIMGAWFLTQAASFIIGGWVATFTAAPKGITDPLVTLTVYADVFLNIGIAAVIIATLMWLTVPKLKKMMCEEAI